MQDRNVLCLERVNIFLEFKLTYLTDNFVLELVVKQKVHVDCEDFDVGVVVEDLLEENVLVLIEELQRLDRDANFLRSLKELHGFERDLFKMNHLGLENPSAKDQGLLVDSSQIHHDFLWCKVRQDHEARANTQVLEEPSLAVRNLLVFDFRNEFNHIRDLVGELAVLTKNAFMGRQEVKLAELALRLLGLGQLSDVVLVEV